MVDLGESSLHRSYELTIFFGLNGAEIKQDPVIDYARENRRRSSPQKLREAIWR